MLHAKEAQNVASGKHSNVLQKEASFSRFTGDTE